MNKNNVITIIDGTNLFYALRKRRYPTRLHYTKIGISLSKKLPAELQPWIYKKTIYNTSSPRQSDNADKYRYWLEFQEMLKKTDRLELKLGRLEGSVGNVREKGVDINIVNDMLEKAFKNEYDILILITGDGDYKSTIDTVKSLGKKVYVSFFENEKSYHLNQAADGFIPFPDDEKTLAKFKYYQRQ